MKLNDLLKDTYEKFNSKIHNEERAITSWLPAKEIEWLIEVKFQTEHNKTNPRKCEILYTGKGSKILYALFYCDGHYKSTADQFYWQEG